MRPAIWAFACAAAAWTGAEAADCRPISELPQDEAAVASVSARYPSYERVRAAFVCFTVRSGSVVLYEPDGTEHYFAYGVSDRGPVPDEGPDSGRERPMPEGDEERPERVPAGRGGGAQVPRPEEHKGGQKAAEGAADERIRDPELADLARRFFSLLSPRCEMYLSEEYRTWKRARFPRVDRAVPPDSMSLRGIVQHEEVQSVLSVTGVSRCELAGWNEAVAASGLGHSTAQLMDVGRRASTLEYVMTALAGRISALVACPAAERGEAACRETPAYALEPLRSAALQAFQGLAGQAAQLSAGAARAHETAFSAASRDRAEQLDRAITEIGKRLSQ